MKLNISKAGNLTGHSGAVYALEQGSEEHLVFSGSSDKFVALWNLNTMEAEKFAAKFPAIVYALCYVKEKQLLLVGTSAGSVHVLDLIKKEEVKILQHHTEAVFDIRYCIQTNCFYTAGGDGNFAVCSLDQLSMLQIKQLCKEKVRSIDINLVTSELAIASGDGCIRIFDLISLEEKHCFAAHQLSANIVKYSPDGLLLLSGGRDAYLNCWDAKGYTAIQHIPAHNYALYDIQFSPDGKQFATASRDKTLKIWNTDTLELLVRINKEKQEGHVNSVNKLLWSTFKNYLISTGDDRAIFVWESQTNQS